MTRFALRLPERQARLIALAAGYHLSRPGAELDPETLADYRHGLAEVLPAIEAQLGRQSVVIELNSLQVVLLSTSLSSVISELKMYSVFDTMSGGSGRPRSTAPGFDDRLRRLFPEIAGDPLFASQLAEEMTMLRRELPAARAREIMDNERKEREAAAAKRPRWQFWRRS